jgi:S-DNA-T family DNA segregation ATPase FtsK/SpoIIIE
MATKKKKKPAPKTKATERRPLFDDLSPHTKQAIGAVAFVVLGLFLVLSLLEWAGMVGGFTKTALVWLFGAGAYLSPIVCGFYVYALIHPKENEPVSRAKVIGIALGFIALLGGLELYQAELGGMLGWLIATPLTYLISEIATGVTLAALFLISIFLLFNVGFRRERTPEPEEAEDTSLEAALAGELPNEALPEPEDDGASEPAPAPGPKIAKKLGLSKEPKEFAVSNFEGPYDPPPLSLLAKSSGKAKPGDAKANANKIKQTLATFGINVEMDEVEIGPTVTRYALKPAQGVKLARIVGLQRELEMALEGRTIRIEAPIPGKSLVGIEVPNLQNATVGLASLLTSPEYTDSPNPLVFALGKDITGHAQFANIARMPHALIAGTTGSGKSVMIHNVIVSLLYRNSPQQLRFIMIDPKQVELTLYSGIPHLLTEVITDAKKALLSLKWAVKEMDRRYAVLKENRVQDVKTYQAKVYKKAYDKWVADGSDEETKADLPQNMPYIVVVMDELADLMSAYPRELEANIVRLAQKSRAVGIHLLIATQRPSVNVITGTIKANIPTRVALKVAQQVDSRTIIDGIGAEKLLGRGDMLFASEDNPKPLRIQSAFVSNDEITAVADYLRDQDEAHSLDTFNIDEDNQPEAGADSFWGAMVDEDEDEEDELYSEAKRVVIETGRASTSYLQRKLGVGYSRAAKLVDMMEERGVVGPQNGSKPRQILVSAEAMEAAEAAPEEDDSEHRQF